jgi:aminopeptidase N
MSHSPSDRGAAPAPDPYSPHTGDRNLHVERYELELACKLGGNRLDGTATLRLTAVPGTERAELDLVGLGVHRVSVNGKKVAFKHRHARLSFPLPAHHAGAPLEVQIRYGGNPGPRLGPWGDVGWEELEDGVLVAGQPDGASTWFPCNDTPGEKSAYRMSITTDAGYRPVAPGALVEHRRTSSRETWVFEQEAPTAAYLATLQIGRYRPRPLGQAGAQGTPLTLYSSDAQAARALSTFSDQAALVETFEAAFGPYPFAGYGVIVTPDELEIPLEAQGLSVFGDNHLTRAWEAQRLIAHEFAHQWFGNSLTVRGWRDLWMHEGFACYAEWLWSEASGSAPLRERARRAWGGLQAAPQDLRIGDPGPADMFDDRVYKRGALTILALRVELGDERFGPMLRAWTARHRHGSVDRALFEAHLLAHAGPGQDPLGVLRLWLDGECLPPFPQP